MTTSLRKLAIRGSIWTIISYGLSNVIRLVGNLVLSRLLFPELFGLMATVSIFITGLSLFSDVGIGPSIIQNKRGNEPEFLNTAWTIQALRGFVLWLGCLLIALPVAGMYGEPRLTWLIPLTGLSTIISGFNSTDLFTLNREINLRKLVTFELGCQLVGLIAIVGWAAFDPSIWALVIGNLISTLVRLFWSHRLIPGKTNWFYWDPQAATEIFSFGKWIFLSTAFTFLAEQSDRLLLGWLISSSQSASVAFTILGVYSIAFMLADVPRQVLTALSNKVLFPVFSKVSDQPRDAFRIKIKHSRKFFLAAGVAGTVLFTSIGDWLINFLYDSRYQNAAWMLPILAIGFWPRILTQTIDQSLFAIGQSRYIAIGCFSKFIYMLVCLPISFYWFGVPGAIIAIAFNDISFYGAVLYGLKRENLQCFSQDLQATAFFIGILTLTLGIRYFMGLDLPFHGLFANNLLN